jgi:hypothetical protein
MIETESMRAVLHPATIASRSLGVSSLVTGALSFEGNLQ